MSTKIEENAEKTGAEQVLGSGPTANAATETPRLRQIPDSFFRPRARTEAA
jgi:hypothetical protein